MSKVAKTKKNWNNCICSKCPSYTLVCKIKAMPSMILAMMRDISKYDHMEGFFCAFEKSSCIIAKKGCICGNCLVYTQYKLDTLSYCIVAGGK